METYLPILIGIIGLLISMWDKVPGGKKVFAWGTIIITTLIIPSIIVIWASMQISASIFASRATNLSDFVSQVGWTVGAFSASYPIIWSIRFYPSLEKYVSELFSESKDDQKNVNVVSNNKGGKS